MGLRDVNDRIGDWLNTTLYYRGGLIDIRVLDVVMMLGFIGFTAYTWLARGWLAAAQMAAVFGFTLLCIVWFFPSNKKMCQSSASGCLRAIATMRSSAACRWR